MRETERDQKEGAIKRHYDVVTNPNTSPENHQRSLHALGILSRDTGRRIIVNILDSLSRIIKEKAKNPLEAPDSEVDKDK